MTEAKRTVEEKDQFVAYLRFRKRMDNHDIKWLSVCSSTDEGAFKVYHESTLTAIIEDRDRAVRELKKASPRNVVAAVIRDIGGRYLIVKRTPEQSQPNKWCFAGGKVEKDESLTDAVIREIREEIGVPISVGSMIHHQIEACENGTWALHYFECELIGEEALKALEVSDFRFVDPCDLPSFDLLPVDIDIAKSIAAKAERDALALRVKELEERHQVNQKSQMTLMARVSELEGEVMKSWQQDPEGNLMYSYCAFCLLGPLLGHDKDCIVRSIQAKA